MLCSLKYFLNHGLACMLFAVFLGCVVLIHSQADAAPVAVRLQEGKTHGFLLVRALGGDIIGQGEVRQRVKESHLVESQLVFTFKDGSLHDEKVAFSQNGVFTLISYHLVQRGPFFPEQVDVLVDRGTGAYKARLQAGKDGQEEVRTGTVDLPKDVYNGMVITTLLNLPKGASETVHILSFRPEPEVIQLQLVPGDERTVHIGNLSRKAVQYSFKPDIGLIKKWLGRLTGQLPDQFHYRCWILTGDVPGFVHYEGPLQLMGPIVQIELTSPALVPMPENGKKASR